MSDISDELMTVEELCECLLIGKTTAYELLASGKIKCFKINRIWKIPRSSVNDYITEMTDSHLKNMIQN